MGAWDPKWSWRGALEWRGLVSRGFEFQTYWKWSPKERGALEHSRVKPKEAEGMVLERVEL